MRKQILKSILSVLLLVIVLWSMYFYVCVDNAQKANVLIECKVLSMFGEGYSVGSGVVISPDGYIITAKHVVENVIEIRITLADGTQYIPVTVVEDKDSDLALLKIDAENLEFVAVKSSDRLHYLSLVYGIGNKQGLFDAKLSLGYVYRNSFKRMWFEDNEMLFINMNIEPGCSGGGLYRYDKLVGIMTNKADDYAFAVSSNEVLNFLQEIGIAL